MQPTMRVNLKLFQMFLLVAEHNSFRAAAERANRSQSAVSTQIKRLEAQLGVALFHRTTRNVRLTAEGELLLGCAHRAINEVELGLRRIEETVDIRHGRISLSCSPTIAATRLARILAAFEQDYPGVNVSVAEVASKVLFENVRCGAADFGVGPLIQSSDFAFEPILNDDIYAIVPKRLFPGVRSTISVEALAKMPLLLLDTASALRALIEETMKSRNLTIETRYQCTQAQTLISMAYAGLGAAVLPEIVLPKTPESSVQVVRIVAPKMTRQVAIITNRGQTLSPAAARLVEHFRQLIGVETDEAVRYRTPRVGVIAGINKGSASKPARARAGNHI